MKYLVKKVKSFWNAEFEISFSKKPKQTETKPKTPYVNPFKHQQDLDEIKRRYAEIQKKQHAKSGQPATTQPVQQPKPEPNIVTAHSSTTQALSKPKRLPGIKRHHVIGTAVVVSMLYVAFPAYMIILQAPKLQQGLPQPIEQQLPKQSVLGSNEYAGHGDDVVEAVSRKTSLPQDETPMTGTITDPEKLHDQKFFHIAQKGDKILIYKKNKKVYMYRPSTQQVLAQAPLQYGNDTAVAGASTSALPLQK